MRVVDWARPGGRSRARGPGSRGGTLHAEPLLGASRRAGRWTGCLVVAALLALACSGGGGGGPATPTAPPVPTEPTNIQGLWSGTWGALTFTMEVDQDGGSFTALATLSGDGYEDEGTLEGTVTNLGAVDWTSPILCGGTFSGELDVVEEQADEQPSRDDRCGPTTKADVGPTVSLLGARRLPCHSLRTGRTPGWRPLQPAGEEMSPTPCVARRRRSFPTLSHCLMVLMLVAGPAVVSAQIEKPFPGRPGGPGAPSGPGDPAPGGPDSDGADSEDGEGEGQGELSLAEEIQLNAVYDYDAASLVSPVRQFLKRGKRLDRIASCGARPVSIERELDASGGRGASGLVERTQGSTCPEADRHRSAPPGLRRPEEPVPPEVEGDQRADEGVERGLRRNDLLVPTEECAPPERRGVLFRLRRQGDRPRLPATPCGQPRQEPERLCLQQPGRPWLGVLLLRRGRNRPTTTASCCTRTRCGGREGASPATTWATPWSTRSGITSASITRSKETVRTRTTTSATRRRRRDETAIADARRRPTPVRNPAGIRSTTT